MSAEEKIAFEEKMASDKSLAEKVVEEKAINEAIYFANLAELRNSVGTDIKNIKYDSGSSNYKYLASALLVMGLGISGYWFLNQKATEGKPAQQKVEVINEQPKEQQETPTAEVITKTEDVTNSTNVKKVVPQINTDIQNSKQTGETETEPVLSDQTIQKVIQTDNPKTNPEIDKQTTNIGQEPLPVSSAKTVECNKTFEITTTPSCPEKPTGSIIIKNSDKEELLIELDHTLTYSPNGELKNVASGQHEIQIKYQEKCEFNQTVTVAEEWCSLNSNFSFNPEYGEKWELKYRDGDRGNFIILNNFGKEVFQGSFGNGNYYWNGSDSYGSSLPTGTYLAIISHSDGRKEKVELTIVR